MQIGKYVLQRYLGNGAFGDVHLANDIALNTTKAIKIIDVENPDEFMEKLEEAQILHKCKHKHIVTVNEAGIYEVEGKPKVIIDMEYLNKGSLEEAMKNYSISIQDSIAYTINCLLALEHAHNQGILHRDIKPANILLCNYGAKLSDFGLATVLGEREAGSPRGYNTHLAPEYFTTKETTVLTDIYAMGITLFRACNYINNWGEITQHTPNINGKLLDDIGYKTFIPSNLKRIIKKACSPNINTRYKSAFEMRQVLERLRPRINWYIVDQTNWEGTCKQTGKNFTAMVINQRNSFQVKIKQNARRVSFDCKSFSSFPEAENYLNSYIANSMFV